MKTSGLAVIVGLMGMSSSVQAQGPSRPVQQLIEVARDLFPEVDSQRVVPAPKSGEPAAVLTARLRPEVAARRVRQASERGRVFAGGAVAGAVTVEDPRIRLAIRGASGHEIGFLVVVGSGREVRIEVRPADEAPTIESLSPDPIEPEPLMRPFPLQD